MAGNVNNAAVWAEADVYIGTLAATTPIGGAAFDALSWDAVGLLNGDDGFGESREMDEDDFFAWGGILVATTRRNFKLNRTFTALEDNETVFGLVYPGSAVTFTDEDYTGTLSVPDMQHKFKIGFETRTGTKVKRVISKNYAQVAELGDQTESESDLATREITVTIYPDSSGVLFDVYKGDAA